MTAIYKSAAIICVAGVVGGHYLSKTSFKPVVEPAATSVQVARPPAEPAPVNARANGMVVLDPDTRGHYQAQVELEGRIIPMLVDTGASYLSLTAEDARSAGIFPAASAFDVRLSTANGESRAALVHLQAARIGTISLFNVDALVMAPGASQISLLGMSFLKKLSSYEMAQGRLIMHQ